VRCRRRQCRSDWYDSARSRWAGAPLAW
jgi:hypothetical protein